MILREEKDGVSDEKKRAFGVFIFYAKKRKIKMGKNDKGSSKKESKDTFNLMVQQLR